VSANIGLTFKVTKTKKSDFEEVILRGVSDIERFIKEADDKGYIGVVAAVSAIGVADQLVGSPHFAGAVGGGDGVNVGGDRAE